MNTKINRHLPCTRTFTVTQTGAPDGIVLPTISPTTLAPVVTTTPAVCIAEVPPYAMGCGYFDVYASACFDEFNVVHAVVTAPTLSTTVTVTVPSVSASTTPTVSSDPIILLVSPVVPARPKGRGLSKRETTGGFVSDTSSGPPTVPSCNESSIFLFGGEKLISSGQPIATNPNVGSIKFGAASATPGGSISTTFSIVGGLLQWSNETFYLGEASFCQDATGEVFANFVSPESWPADCAAVNLVVYQGKSIC